MTFVQKRFAVATLVSIVLLSGPSTRAVAADMDSMVRTYFEMERLEFRAQNGVDVYAWDAQGWVGGDTDKLWFKTEGAAPREGKVEEAEVQLLYSRMISDFFDLQAGLRHDVRPAPDRTYGVIGLKGMAPYFIETDAAAFVSEKGEVSARLKAATDFLLTQRLVLEPSGEVNLYGSDVAEYGIGKGVADVELGLRLRYEIRREFAPYVGINWHRKLGETAVRARADGEGAEEFSLLAGLRFWF
jgi:copper resistance protein B